MDKSIAQVGGDDFEDHSVAKSLIHKLTNLLMLIYIFFWFIDLCFDAFYVRFLLALFNAEALDVVANEGEEDMSS